MVPCDCTATIKPPLALPDRTKHVEVDKTFHKGKLQTKQICIPFVKTEDQIANVFTKGLCGPSFNRIICKVGMHNIF